eukprot:768431-Hanusia_phi.AAC.13
MSTDEEDNKGTIEKQSAASSLLSLIRARPGEEESKLKHLRSNPVLGKKVSESKLGSFPTLRRQSLWAGGYYYFTGHSFPSSRGR